MIRFEIPIIDAYGGRKLDSHTVEQILTNMHQHAPNPQVNVVVLGTVHIVGQKDLTYSLIGWFNFLIKCKDSKIVMSWY